MQQKLSTTHAASAVVLAACGGLFHECATLQKIVLVAFFITDTGPWYRRQTGCNKSIYLNRFSDSGHLANVCSHSLFTSCGLFFFPSYPFFKRVFFLGAHLHTLSSCFFATRQVMYSGCFWAFSQKIAASRVWKLCR